METETYRLPDNTLIEVDATASRNAPEIDFMLKGGQIVKAQRFRSRSLRYTPVENELALTLMRQDYHLTKLEALARAREILDAN